VKELVGSRARDRASKPGLVLSDRGGVVLTINQIARQEYVAVAAEEEILEL
jgi:hypothetical protein